MSQEEQQPTEITPDQFMKMKSDENLSRRISEDAVKIANLQASLELVSMQLAATQRELQKFKQLYEELAEDEDPEDEIDEAVMNEPEPQEALDEN